MVALILKAEIEALNIDTVERAIVFAALALRAAIVGADNSNNQSRQITLNTKIARDNTVTLSIGATLPFNAYNFHVFGGDLFSNLIEVEAVTNDLSGQFNFEVKPSTPTIPIIPDYPEREIITFEQYLLYYSLTLFASLESKRNNYVKLSFLSGTKGHAQIKLSLEIPINLNKWLLGDNYINSTRRIVDNYSIPNLGNVISILTNAEILTNEIILIN